MSESDDVRVQNGGDHGSVENGGDHGNVQNGDHRGASPTTDVGSDSSDSETETVDRQVYVTRGLVDVLLEMAETAEPNDVNVVLAPTPAGEFDADLGIDPETPVLTHFYMSEAGGSVSAVFGMDLGTPAGRGRARFLTHPQGPFELTERDDLAAVVLLAVPPWEDETFGAFDRAGRTLELTILDAEPPTEELA
ncbi:hypothetical protein KU306_12620 [Haloferax larsenii]|uniref:Proteasome lid subunit RPN8/RPN11, contains Jab1/MPN metalloenzyme (JAMM) motif n=1 Tax=Haloferax larsenii TaxID=302484 RepID=A0ABY5RBP9_HALLR|nr:hypothetical protein [Haloferax larsenii]UVE49747.1 hypothetical protein KU306_12620 [Haloferax larsenii]